MCTNLDTPMPSIYYFLLLLLSVVFVDAVDEYWICYTTKHKNTIISSLNYDQIKNNNRASIKFIESMIQDRIMTSSFQRKHDCIELENDMQPMPYVMYKNVNSGNGGIVYLYFINCKNKEDYMDSNIEKNILRRSTKHNVIQNVKSVEDCKAKCKNEFKTCGAFNYVESAQTCDILHSPLTVKIYDSKTKSKLNIPAINNRNVQIIVNQYKYLNYPIEIVDENAISTTPLPTKNKRKSLILSVSVVLDAELQFFKSWLQSLAASIPPNSRNIKLCIVISKEKIAKLMTFDNKQLIKYLQEKLNVNVYVHYQPAYNLYKFPFVKIQTCLNNVKGTSYDDVVFSTDIYSKYSPLVFTSLKYFTKCKDRLVYPIILGRGGHDISQFAACVGDAKDAVSKLPLLTVKDNDYALFFTFFSILKLNIIRNDLPKIFGMKFVHNKEHYQEFETIKLFKGSTSKFGRKNSIKYQFLHHSTWTKSQDDIIVDNNNLANDNIIFNGKTDALGNVYNAILVERSETFKRKEKVKAFIYSSDLHPIKSILISGAFVNVNIGDEIYFHIDNNFNYNNQLNNKQFDNTNSNSKNNDELISICIVYGKYRDELNIKDTKCHAVKYISNRKWNLFDFDLNSILKQQFSNIQDRNLFSIHVSISSSLLTSGITMDETSRSKMLFLLDDFGVEFEKPNFQAKKCRCFKGLMYDNLQKQTLCSNVNQKFNADRNNKLKNEIRKKAFWLRSFV
jgi:hypothetical protein